MTGRDPVAGLIPWYAAGTLDPRESEQVEAHLSSCDDCRDLLVLARGFRRLAPQAAPEALFDHIQSQRLVEFAADPATLEPDARRFITKHTQACPVCAEALEILEDLGRAPVMDDGAGSRRHGAAPHFERILEAWREVWRRLSRTILRPAPALVYLTALLVALVLLQLRPPAPGAGAPPPIDLPGSSAPPAGSPARPPVSFVPPAFDLLGEIVFRGDERRPVPVVIPLRAGAEVVALSLVTGVDSEDLEDPAASFRVEIRQGDRVVLDAGRTAADFDRRGRLGLLLDPAALAAGLPCQVRLLLVKPGDPRDGEEIYHRAFRLALSTDASPRP